MGGASLTIKANLSLVQHGVSLVSSLGGGNTQHTDTMRDSMWWTISKFKHQENPPRSNARVVLCYLLQPTFARSSHELNCCRERRTVAGTCFCAWSWVSQFWNWLL